MKVNQHFKFNEEQQYYEKNETSVRLTGASFRWKRHPRWVRGGGGGTRESSSKSAEAVHGNGAIRRQLNNIVVNNSHIKPYQTNNNVRRNENVDGENKNEEEEVLKVLLAVPIGSGSSLTFSKECGELGHGDDLGVREIIKLETL